MRAIPGFELRGARGAPSSAQPRRTAATLLTFFGAITLLLSACSIGGGGSTSIALAKNQTFNWPFVDSATGSFAYDTPIDPAVVSTALSYSIVSMLYTNLVTFDANLKVIPDAALSWDISSDAKSYTFHLRHGMKFSDGKPLTAADFAYSMDRAIDPQLCGVRSPTDPSVFLIPPTYTSDTYTPASSCSAIATAHLNYLVGFDARFGGQSSSDIANKIDPGVGLNVIDSYTLRINLTQPIPFFLDALTYPTGDAVEQSFITQPKYLHGKWVDHLDQGGESGPYKIQSLTPTEMTLVPNTYWEQAFGKTLHITKILRPAISDYGDEYKAYTVGQYDYTDVELNQYQFAHGQGDFHDVVALATDYFSPNFNQAPFDNLYVRQAFDLTLNKQLLVDGQESGGAVPTNHIVPEGMQGFNTNLVNPAPDSTQTLTGDQSAATALMDKVVAQCNTEAAAFQPMDDYCAYIPLSSNTSPAKSITIWAPNDSTTRVNLANAAAQMWNSALRVDVKVNAQPFSVIVDNLFASPNTMQMWEIGWIADYPDPQDWLSIQFHTNGGSNLTGMADPAFDKIVDKADVEQDPKARLQEYQQAEQVAVNEVGWIPFDQPKIAWRMRTYVHGFNYNAMGVMVDLSWPNVYIAAS